MDLSLQGRRALITGSTKGIGKAIAESLAAAQSHIVIHGRQQNEVNRVVAELRLTYPNIEVAGAVANLSSLKGAKELFEQVPDTDILINNAGFFEQVPAFELSDDQWDKMWQTNVMSGVRLSNHYLPRMLARRSFGRVIFISSECGEMIPPDMIHYGVSKTAQIALSRGLAELTRGTQVTVNSVLPGPTLTEGVADFLKEMALRENITIDEMSKRFFESYRPTSLISRFISPKEVADMVTFIASPLAAATNGAKIRVDGGTVRSL